MQQTGGVKRKRCSNRKQQVVRLLERAVNLAFANANPNSMSGLKPDRSEQSARQLVKKLKALAEFDPDNKFGVVFARLQLRIFAKLGIHKQ